MKRKNITRILTFALMLGIILSLSCPITTFASDESLTAFGDKKSNSQVQTNAQDYTESEISDNNGDSNKNKDTNVFDLLYEGISKNLSEILSALAFIASIILMFCYKKGFLPLVTEGIKALASGVKNIGEKTESLNVGTEALTEKIKQRLDTAEDVLTKMSKTLETLEEKIGSEEENKNQRAELKTVLSAEIDMLYEIFMAASLPHS